MIDALNRVGEFKVQTIDIPAEPRSLRRYWWQFIMFPLLVLRLARSCTIVVLYQEDLSFLIPIIRLAGGRAGVLVHHIPGASQDRSVVERLKSLYIKLTLPIIATADMVLVPSEATSHEVLARMNVPASRLHVVPCPFDDRYVANDAHCPFNERIIARDRLNERFGISLDKTFVILNVGSDETRKNNVTLLLALAELERKDVVLVRVGSAINPANRAECKRIASEANLSVHFVGKVNDDDLRHFYHAANAYASPSVHEGFGRTVIEAQLAGLPVVASALQVYRDTMGSSFLPIRDPLNPKAWANAINELMADPSLVRELVQLGRANSRRFSAEVVSALLRDNLRRLEPPPAARPNSGGEIR
jgi:glycosyltransferase involved in cell wall biosynthesis